MQKDAHKYKSKILKGPLLVVYDEIYWARNARLKAARALSRLLHLAAKAQETPTDHKISPDGEKERSRHRGFGEEVASTECKYSLAECKKRQVCFVHHMCMNLHSGIYHFRIFIHVIVK